jgi:cyanophycin synthetase
MSQLRRACEQARRVTQGPLMIEQMVQGADHRLTVIGGKLVAAVRREAPSVVGDGQKTIRQLIGQLNAGRTAKLAKRAYLRPVALDDALGDHLAQQGLHIDAVPPDGARITLRSNANVSTGGVPVDVTDRVHPAVAALAEQLAATVGLDVVGLDYLTPDITLSPLEGRGAFIEMNTSPALGALAAAGYTAEEIGSLVLGEGPGRIPVDLCVLAAADSETARRIVAKPPDPSTAAWACGTALQVGALELTIADAAPWATVRSALRNKTVTSLQIVCTVDDILAHGLPVDRLDRVVLAGVSLPEPWHAVIARTAASVAVLSPEAQPTENS